MRVAELMQTNLRTIQSDEPLVEAITLIAEGHISGLPVVDGHGRLVGVLSSSDVLQAIAEAETNAERSRIFEQLEVRDVMTPRPQTLGPEATLKEAAQRMLYSEVHRLFVEDKDRLVGIITTSDLVRAIAGATV